MRVLLAEDLGHQRRRLGVDGGVDDVLGVPVADEAHVGQGQIGLGRISGRELEPALDPVGVTGLRGDGPGDVGGAVGRNRHGVGRGGRLLAGRARGQRVLTAVILIDDAGLAGGEGLRLVTEVGEDDVDLAGRGDLLESGVGLAVDRRQDAGLGGTVDLGEAGADLTGSQRHTVGVREDLGGVRHRGAQGGVRCDTGEARVGLLEGLQHEGRQSGDVRGGHRGTRHDAVLVVVEGRVDRSADAGDLRLEVEVRGGTPRGEARGEQRIGVVDQLVGLGELDRHLFAGLHDVGELLAVVMSHARDRDGGAFDTCHAGDVVPAAGIVEDDDTGRTLGDGVLHLVGEGDLTALDEGPVALDLGGDLVGLADAGSDQRVSLEVGGASLLLVSNVGGAALPGGLRGSDDLVDVVDGGDGPCGRGSCGATESSVVEEPEGVDLVALGGGRQAVVAGGDDDLDAGVLGVGDGEGLTLVGGVHAIGRAEGHVDDVGAASHRFLDGGDDVIGVGRSGLGGIVGEHLHGEQLGLGGGAVDASIGDGVSVSPTVGSHDAGNVHAVLGGSGVLGVVVAVGEVVAIRHLVGESVSSLELGAGLALGVETHVLVLDVDTGVDDGDDSASSVESGLASCGGPGRQVGVVIDRLVSAHRLDGGDAWLGLQSGDVRGLHPGREPLEEHAESAVNLDRDLGLNGTDGAVQLGEIGLLNSASGGLPLQQYHDLDLLGLFLSRGRGREGRWCWTRGGHRGRSSCQRQRNNACEQSSSSRCAHMCDRLSLTLRPDLPGSHTWQTDCPKIWHNRHGARMSDPRVQFRPLWGELCRIAPMSARPRRRN